MPFSRRTDRIFLESFCTAFVGFFIYQYNTHTEPCNEWRTSSNDDIQKSTTAFKFRANIENPLFVFVCVRLFELCLVSLVVVYFTHNVDVAEDDVNAQCFKTLLFRYKNKSTTPIYTWSFEERIFHCIMNFFLKKLILIRKTNSNNNDYDSWHTDCEIFICWNAPSFCFSLMQPVCSSKVCS